MLERISWLLLALVHLMPALALFRPTLLNRLYGLKSEDPLFLLMQHRAALFFAILLLCLWSVFDRTPRSAAALATAISMVSFLWLYWQNGMPPSLGIIAKADAIGLPALAFVCWQAVMHAAARP
jgi:hypothetical protein